VCTRVDVGENDRVAQQTVAAEGVGTLMRARVVHEEEGSWTGDPGRGEGNAAAPVGAGNSLDMAHGGQTLVGCGAADGVVDGEEAAGSGNGALDGHREERADDEGDVAVGAVVVVVVVDDYEGTAVVAPVAELVAAAVAVAAGLVAVAVYAL
jgi:hypothetical protein